MNKSGVLTLRLHGEVTSNDVTTGSSKCRYDALGTVGTAPAIPDYSLEIYLMTEGPLTI